MAKGLAVAETVRIARDVARGLAKAHERGVVHRDLKPDNVMLTEEGDVKILDFGIAKLWEPATPEDALADTAAPATMHGHVMGTPAYMSPEQARGESADARSDVFSFGAMFYELLTDCRPFTGEMNIAILYSVIHTDPVPPNQMNAEIPASLADVVMRCLAKDREKRYASGRELLAALDAHASGENAPPSDPRHVVPAEPTPAVDMPAPGSRRPDIVIRPSSAAAMSAEKTDLEATITPEALAAEVALLKEGPPRDLLVKQAERVATPPRKVPRWVVLLGILLVAIPIGLMANKRLSKRRDENGVSQSALASASGSAMSARSSSTPMLREHVLPGGASSKSWRAVWDVSPSGQETVFKTDDGELRSGPIMGGFRPLSLPPQVDSKTIERIWYSDERTLQLSTLTAATPGHPEASFLWTMRVDGTGAASRPTDPHLLLPAPGGRNALFTDESGSSVGDADGANRQPVNGVVGSSCFAWSPNGESFAYLDQRHGQWFLNYRASGGTPGTVVDSATYVSHVLGSLCALAFRDATRVVAARYSGPNDGEVTFVEYDVGKPGDHGREIGGFYNGAFDALKFRGDRMFARQTHLTQGVVAVPFEDAGANVDDVSVVAADASENLLLDVDRTGRLAFLSFGPEGNRINVAVDRANPRRVFSDDQVDLDARFASDGALIAIRAAVAEGGYECSLVRAQGENLTRKEEIRHWTGGPAIWGRRSECGRLACAAHANVCVLLSLGERGYLVTPFDPVTGAFRDRRATNIKASTFALSGDGQTLAGVDGTEMIFGSNSISTLDIATGVQHQTSPLVTPSLLQAISYTADDRGYLLSGMNEESDATSYQVITTDLAGQHARIIRAESDAWLAAPRASPDGKRVFFTRRRFNSELVVFEP